MISAVAFCPSAPVLVPDVAQGAAPELDALRAACRTAIRAAAGPDPGSVVLLAAHDTGRSYGARSRGSLRGLGVPLEVGLGPDTDGPCDLPLPLTVGAWLVRDALGPDVPITGTTVAAHPPAQIFGDADAEADVAVIVVGDGSARRTLKAPGYLDERAAPFDTTVQNALRSGDVDTLAALDAGLGAELLASGVPAWRAIAPVLAGRAWEATLHYADDPYGVRYFAASWLARA